jgi:hypothetical protein
MGKPSTQSFQDLFSSSDKSYVHYVDTVYEYTDVDNFTALLAFDSYLNTYTNPMLKKVDNEVVKARINKQTEPATPSTAWESWQRDTIEIIFDKQVPPQFTPTPASLVKEITSAIQGLKEDNVKSSHALANSYMDQIMFAIGKWKYIDVRKKLVDNYNLPANSSTIDANLRIAIQRIDGLIGQTNETVLAELKKVATDALDFWVKDKPAELFLLAGLSDGPSFHKTMIRNALREYIYKNLYLQAINEPNDAILQYMKRILADLFIICFYPYIHYLYSSQLQDYFIKRGQFINMRSATSAKVMVVINSIELIKKHAGPSPGGIAKSGQELTSSSPEFAQLTAITETLNAYFANLSNPIFEEPSKKFGDVDIEVRNLAKDVYDLNLSIDDLKKWVKETQLQIRSHSAVYKSIDGTLKSKRTQYILHIVFIVLLVVVVGVLIKFNIYLDYTLYALAFIITFFIIVRIVSIIISLL